MSFEIEGEYNTATVHTKKPRDECEQEALDQIQEMVDHEAFYGDGDVSIMPDFHWGSGAVIGFTMPVKDRVVPNTIGVDIGCGMLAEKFENITIDQSDTELLEQIDTEIRDRVPMGFDVHDRTGYHMINDFPWTTCEQKWDWFAEATDFDMPTDEAPKYPRKTYFKDLCQKIGYDQGRAINSVGSLGGGNHFIELGTDDNGDLWCIIHSGSRGIGAEIAEYWQKEASERTFERNAKVDIPESERKYFKAESLEGGMYGLGGGPVLARELTIDRDAVLEDYDGEAIEGKFGQLKSYLNHNDDDSSPLDYLEGDEAIGYIKDMIFAQTYASESRKQMMGSVWVALESACGFGVTRSETIESVHNYIDFEDATIRKGACRAHEGERLVVPFNMSYGTIIARGRGSDTHNNSSAHGAGRAMSRTQAHDQFDQDDFDDQIGDVFMSKQPMDEIPGAYKPAEQIEQALQDTVEIETRVEPFMSIKAE